MSSSSSETEKSDYYCDISGFSTPSPKEENLSKSGPSEAPAPDKPSPEEEISKPGTSQAEAPAPDKRSPGEEIPTQSECPIYCHLPESSGLRRSVSCYDLSSCKDHLPVLAAFSRLSFRKRNDIDSLIRCAEESIIRRGDSSSSILPEEEGAIAAASEEPHRDEDTGEALAVVPVSTTSTQTDPVNERLRLEIGYNVQCKPYKITPLKRTAGAAFGKESEIGEQFEDRKRHLSSCYLTVEFWEKCRKEMEEKRKNLYPKSHQSGEEGHQQMTQALLPEAAKCYHFGILEDIAKALLDLMDKVITLMVFISQYPLKRYADRPYESQLPLPNFLEQISEEILPQPKRLKCEGRFEPEKVNELFEKLYGIWNREVRQLDLVLKYIGETLKLCRDLKQNSPEELVRLRSDTTALLTRISEIEEKCIQVIDQSLDLNELGAITYLIRLNYQTSIACQKFSNHLNHLNLYIAGLFSNPFADPSFDNAKK